MQAIRVSPSGGDWGDPPPATPPFHAVFGYYAQNDTPQINPNVKPRLVIYEMDHSIVINPLLPV